MILIWYIVHAQFIHIGLLFGFAFIESVSLTAVSNPLSVHTFHVHSTLTFYMWSKLIPVNISVGLNCWVSITCLSKRQQKLKVNGITGNILYYYLFLYSLLLDLLSCHFWETIKEILLKSDSRTHTGAHTESQIQKQHFPRCIPTENLLLKPRTGI